MKSKVVKNVLSRDIFMSFGGCSRGGIDLHFYTLLMLRLLGNVRENFHNLMKLGTSSDGTTSFTWCDKLAKLKRWEYKFLCL